MMNETPPSLGSREVESFLVAYHDIAEDQRDNYVLRLRNITRSGFPAGLASGRGVPAKYDAAQFFQMVAVSELGRCGVAPNRAIKLVTISWEDMRASVLRVWRSVDAAERGELLTVPTMFWRVPAEASQALVRADRPYAPDEDDVISTMDLEAASALLAEPTIENRRHIFIDVKKVIEGVFRLLKWGSSPMTPARIAAFMSTMEAAPR